MKGVFIGMSEENKIKHNITIANRQNISITGVLDVISFDEEMIVAETEMGIMILKGMNLHVNKLDLNRGDLDIDGEIYSLLYEEKNTYGKPAGSFFSKIFR